MQMVVLLDKWQLYRPSSACQCFASLLLSSGISFEVPEEEASRKGREGEERGRCIMGRFHPSQTDIARTKYFFDNVEVVKP